MEQVLSIYLPLWDVELVRRRFGKNIRRSQPALLLFSVKARQETVARCCATAYEAGVFPGMSLAEARALCPEAEVEPFQPGPGQQALLKLASWAMRFSPVVMIDPIPTGHHFDTCPDGLLLDMTGIAPFFGGTQLLITEISTRLSRMGFHAQVAFAPTIAAAWGLARFGKHACVVVDEAHLEEALSPLPVRALRLAPELCAAMEEVNVTLIRHLLRLPRESLIKRFGLEVLQRLDQAFGRIHEGLTPHHPTAPLAVQQLFDGATVQLEAILLSVQNLVTRLAQKLLEQESGVRGLKLTLTRINASPVMREFVLGRASRDAEHLWKLVRPKVEGMHLGYGVEAITLTAHWMETIRHNQSGAWELGNSPDAHDQEYQALLDTLVNRWGQDRVLAAHPVASHVPEVVRTFRPVHEHAEAEGATPAIALLDRPSVLFEEPEPAQAMALQPDYPPAWIQWRGQEFRLEKGSGPERLVTTWWEHGKEPSTRDYFTVQTQCARWLWIFRERETGHWFVHGMWA